MSLKIAPYVVTIEDAYKRLSKVATERPDYTSAPAGDTAGCRYFFDDGTPACIVGAAFEDVLRQHGVDKSDTMNELGVEGLWDNGIFEYADGDPCLELQSPTHNFLETVQSYQDQGSTWAVALENAVRNRDIDIDTAALAA